MQSTASTIKEYLSLLSDDRKKIMAELRNVIGENLPKGFEEIIAYGMISYVVPHSSYPDGYHCDPRKPLPFMSIASQKNFVAVHHMGIYGDEKLLNWFQAEYPKYSKEKLDMGKGCIRFKKPEQIPLKLIAELVSKISPEKWVGIYESKWKKKK